VSAVVALGCPLLGRAEPFVPAADGEVLERLPIAPLDPRARRLRELRAELAARPDDLALATRVAGLYIEAGRSLSDPRYYGYAQGALAPWWSQAAPPAAVLVLRATIRQHDHDFGAALSDLSLALQADPTNAQAWLTQAVVQQVRGEYAAARRSCLAVLPLANPLVAVTCVNGVDSLTGSAAQSYAALRRALERQTNADVAARLWALTTLAEVAARSGQATRADTHFQQALGLGRRDDYLLAAYADFLLDQDRPADVRALLRGMTQSDALLLRLVLAEARLDAPERQQHQQMLRDRFAAARLRGDTVHRREEARCALHLLGEPSLALALARDNWAVQREPADARILLEAARAAGDPAAARPVLAFLAATGLEDATLSRAVAPFRAAPS
jgi:Tfp pilus assembly protein PilF